jgi:hypothetical protein
MSKAGTDEDLAGRKKANSLRNLRPAAKGEVRNPLGRNGRTRAEIVAQVMEEADEDEPESMKIERVVRAMYKRAIKNSDLAAKTLVEQYAGKAVAQTVQMLDASGRPVDPSGPMQISVSFVSTGPQPVITEARADGTFATVIDAVAALPPPDDEGESTDEGGGDGAG